MQQEWGKALLKWDHPPGMSTEQESKEAGDLAGRTDLAENCSVLSYLGSDFFPFPSAMQHQVNSDL